MKIPETFSDREDDLEAFVAAAKTEDLAAACKLLFINGLDLEWTNYTPGQYLVEIAADPDFEDEFRQAEQLTKARADLALRRLMQRFAPALVQILSGLPPDDDDGARRTHMIDGIVKTAEDAKLEQRFLPFMIAELAALSDLLAEWLLEACASTRKRVVGAAGMTDDEYGHFIYCLLRIKELVGPVIRLAFPADGSIPEISFASAGLVTTDVEEDAHEVNIYEVNQRLQRHKRGEDAALPLFIAKYLNSHAPMPDRQAYPGARYGDPSTPEYDVVVPELKIAFEVKLYCSAATQTDDKLEQKPEKLAKQLEAYALRAGAKVIYYVTNLSREQATRVLQEARMVAKNLPKTTEIIPVCGVVELLALLRTVTMNLEQAMGRRLERAMPPEVMPKSPPTPEGT